MEKFYSDSEPRERTNGDDGKALPRSTNFPELPPLHLNVNVRGYGLLTALLALMMVIVSEVKATVTMTPVSETDNSSGSNFLCGNPGPTYAVKIEKTVYSTTTPFYVFMPSHPNCYGNRAQITNKDGGVIARATSSSGYEYRTLGVGKDYLLNICKTCTDLYLFTITYSTGTGPTAISLYSSYNNAYNGGSVYSMIEGGLSDQPMTNYLYAHSSVGTGSCCANVYIVKYYLWTTGRQNWNNYALSSPSNTYIAQNIDENVFFLSLVNGMVNFINKGTITLIMERSGVLAVAISQFKKDKFRSYYHATHLSSPVVSCYDYLNTTMNKMIVNFGYTAPTNYDMLVTIESLQLVVLFSSVSVNIHVLSSTDYSNPRTFTKLYNTALHSVTDPYCWTSPAVPDLRCQFVFASAGTSYVNTQSIFMQFTGELTYANYCYVKYCRYCPYTDNTICSECIEGFGLTSTTQCTRLDGLVSKGLDHSTQLIRACSDPNCEMCEYNYKICRACKDPASPLVYLYNNGCSTDLTGYAQGTGKVLPGGSTGSCSHSYCTKCFMDTKFCFQSDIVAYSNYVPHMGIITYIPNIPAGYGVNRDTTGYGYSRPCSDPNCAICQNNYKICTQCQREIYDYSLQTFLQSGKCIFASAIPDGLGPDLTTLAIKTCTQNNCAKCSKNWLVCEECNLVQPNVLLGGICYYPWTLPTGYGLNSALRIGQRCLELQCQDCRLDFTKCVQCTTFTITRLYLYLGRCYPSSQVPQGWGINTSNSSNYIFSPCQPTNCRLCASSYTSCAECYRTDDPIYVLSSSQCRNVVTYWNNNNGPVLPLPTSGVTTCSVGYCINCKRDYRVCDQCDPASSYPYLRDNACISVGAIPSGYGADPTTKKIYPCTDPRCSTCQADYTKCTACIAKSNGPGQGYLYNSNCTIRRDLPVGYGGNYGSYIAALCTSASANCASCSNTQYTECNQCKVNPSSQTYLSIATTPSCILPSSIAATASQGADSTYLIIRTCLDRNCAECKNDYKVCTLCKTATPQYILHSGYCTLPASLPYGFGADMTNKVSKPCSDVNCQNCQNVFSTCVSCKIVAPPATQYYMNAGSCVLSSSLATGMGANPVTVSAAACVDTHCEDCKSRIDVCIKCKSETTQYYAFGGACILPASIPDGFGADLTNRKAVVCQDTNCQNCRNDYTKCISCKVSSPQRFSYLNLCKIPIDLPAGTGGNTLTKIAQACQITDCVACQENYLVCFKCKTAVSPSPQKYLHNGDCVVPSSFLPGFGVDSVSLQALPCVDKKCADCKANYANCYSCQPSADPTKQTFLYMNKCIIPAELPAQTGANWATLSTSACQNSNCLDCSTDYTKCLRCKISATASSQYYLFNNDCVLISTATSGFGADTVAKTIRPCQSSTCFDCKNNFKTCTMCRLTNNATTQTYLLAGSCYLAGDLPVGYGPNLVTRMGSQCPTNCQECRETSSKCTLCSQQAATYYIYNNLCYTLFSLPAGWGAGPAPEYKAMKCLDDGCLDCKEDYTKCSICKSTPTMYYLHAPDQRCYLKENIPIGYGLKLSGSRGETQACAIPLCSECNEGYMTCSKCQNATPKLFLHKLSCVPYTDLPDYYGGNYDTLASAQCAISGCLSCKENYRICTKCGTSGGKQLYLDSEKNDCVASLTVTNGYGIDSDTKAIKRCLIGHCNLCREDYKLCRECDYLKGYVLMKNSCQKASDLTFIPASQNLQDSNFDFTLIAKFENELPTAYKDDIVQTVAERMDFNISIKEVETGQIVKSAKEVYKLGTDYILKVRIADRVYSKDFIVTTSTSKPVDMQFDGVYYSYRNVESSNNFTKLPDSPVPSSLNWIKYITYYPTTVRNYTGLLFMGGLLALDPTGTFFRFTKILQIVNKLYFININYGKRLEAFLDLSQEPYPDPDPQNARYILNTRPRLDKKNVPINVWEESGILTGVYLAVFLVRLYLAFNNIEGWALFEGSAYFCHYANKVHLIIFNLVFIDFIWLAPRTLLHSRDLHFAAYYGTLVVCFIMMVDLCLILAHLLDDRIWSKAYMHYSNNVISRPMNADELLKENKDMVIDRDIDPQTGKPKLTMTVNKAALDLRMKRINPSTVPKKQKQINYKKTYFEIDFNVHLMNYTAANMDLSENSVHALLPKLLFFFNWGGVPVMCLTTMSFQNNPTLGLGILFIFEAWRFFATIYAYLKYKYLKNIICFLIEFVSRVGSLGIFFLALSLSPKRFDEIIMDFYQDAGIWIVIASCVAEYLLLITYIAVAAYEFFKNRKMMKKMNVKPVSYSPVVYEYVDVPAAEQVPQGPEHHPVLPFVKMNTLRKPGGPAQVKRNAVSPGREKMLRDSRGSDDDNSAKTSSMKASMKSSKSPAKDVPPTITEKEGNLESNSNELKKKEEKDNQSKREKTFVESDEEGGIEIQGKKVNPKDEDDRDNKAKSQQRSDRGQDQSDQESEAKNRDRKDSNNYRGQTDENSDEMDKSKYKNFDGSNEKSRSRSGSSDPDFKEKSIKATSAKNQGKSSLFNSKMMAEMRAVKDKKKQLAMKNPVDGETRIRYVSSLYIPPENN
jgi:hypothetical protein